MTVQETAPGSGAWKYSVILSYDVASLKHGPSHFNLILAALTNCPCARKLGFFTFEPRASTSPGNNQITGLPCTVAYDGLVDWVGDSTLPQLTGPALEWDVPLGSTCEPLLTGTATLRFVSLLPPGAPSSTAATIKLGSERCSGTVTGTLPSCDCLTPVQPGTWGRVKSIYR